MVKKISISSSNDGNLRKYLKKQKKNFNLKNDNFISLNYLIAIKNYYKDEKEKNISEDINNLFNKIREIEEEVRNKVAHRMINITEEFIKDKVGLSSKEILQKNEELLKKVLKKNIDFVYDEINKKIIDLLQKPKE